MEIKKKYIRAQCRLHGEHPSSDAKGATDKENNLMLYCCADK
jgi:hypothetical protein